MRQSNRGKLPENVLWRPKDNYFDPLKYTGLAQGHQALELLEQISNCSCLQEIIDIKQIETSLNGYRQEQSLSNDLVNKIYALLAFVNWYQRVESHYVL
jgi:asparagine synthase (glutamine-hydrolysing)